MENRQQQILLEIKTLAASVRSQMETLEMKILELQHILEPEAVTASEILEADILDMELSPVVLGEVMEMPDLSQQEEIQEVSSVDTQTEVSVEITEETSEEIIEETPEEISEGAFEEVRELEDDDLPFFEDLPGESEELPVAEVSVADSAPAILNDIQQTSDVPVVDAMLDKHAWRTDMPGTAVKDIRSAISLNDRILFINFLFNEDPIAFQETLTKLNSMASFDDAATYMMSAFPHWNWESDTVYRFMMALRRRLQ